ncbi:hypothetical protein B0H13DRAFT_1901339 [Mycena leptocephala]|nr:hypothetical protein B0H13DRAFT_1901339 [Mycena leptocephala]
MMVSMYTPNLHQINIYPSGMMLSSLAAASSNRVRQVPMSHDVEKNLERADQSQQKKSSGVVVVKDKSKSDNGNHTIDQIEPINGPIGCIANNKQAALSSDDHLILIPPPLQPLLPFYLLNLCQGTVAYVHYFKFLQHLVGGKSVASVERVQVGLRTQVVPELKSQDRT